MGQKAEKIWEAFKGELVVEPTDDMREALATSIKETINQLQRGTILGAVIMCADVLELCEELEAL